MKIPGAETGSKAGYSKCTVLHIYLQNFLGMTLARGGDATSIIDFVPNIQMKRRSCSPAEALLGILWLNLPLTFGLEHALMYCLFSTVS